MNEFKKFIKNEEDNWEEYKDLINEDTKFMMKDEDGTEIEMTPREVINQLYQDNKSLEYCINNLQSKIDKAINKLEKYGLVDKNGNFNAYLDTIELKELYDDLKDDKIQEIPQFEGTMKQLDELCEVKK